VNARSCGAGDGQGKVDGILSERDIVRVLAERGAKVLGRGRQSRDDAPGRQCAAVDTVGGIMEMMTIGKFRHLPVLEDGKVAV